MSSHLSWRAVSYAFVVIDDAVDAGEQTPFVRQLAVGGMADESPFYSVISRADCESGTARTVDELCPELSDLIEGRVVVVHGILAGWRRLCEACPHITTLAVLDSLNLARTLMPGGDHSIGGLAERLSVTQEGAPSAGRDAALLAGVFEQLVRGMLPDATLGELLEIAQRSGAYPLPELGLENGT